MVDYRALLALGLLKKIRKDANFGLLSILYEYMPYLRIYTFIEQAVVKLVSYLADT